MKIKTEGKTIFITGFSGTYKSSILNLTKRTIIPTPTKFMITFDNEYLCQESGVNPLNMLSAQIWRAIDYPSDILSVERTVYDYIYFLRYHNLPDWNVLDPTIEQIVIDMFKEIEDKMFPNRTYFITYNLDRNHIEKNLIGKDYSRSTIYNSVEDYLAKQDDYFKLISKCISKGYILYVTEEISDNMYDGVYENLEDLPWEEFLIKNNQTALDGRSPLICGV